MNVFKRYVYASAQEVTNHFRSGPSNFDQIFKKLEVLSLGNGKCVAEMVIEESQTNSLGTLHGGYSAALADVVASIGLTSLEKAKVPHVSVNLNQRYFKAGQLGKKILIESETIKCGKTMAFLEVVIKEKDTGDILVKSEHTNYLLQPK